MRFQPATSWYLLLYLPHLLPYQQMPYFSFLHQPHISPAQWLQSVHEIICQFYFQDVDIQIGSMFIQCDKQCEILTQLHQEVSHLPTLISQLQAITDSLGWYAFINQRMDCPKISYKGNYWMNLSASCGLFFTHLMTGVSLNSTNGRTCSDALYLFVTNGSLLNYYTSSF